MAELRTIDYSDIPDEAILEIEALFGHDREDEEGNLLLLISADEANFSAEVIDKIISLAESSSVSGPENNSCALRADIVSEVFMSGARHDQIRVEIFLRLESNIAFHLFGVQDTHYHSLTIVGLHAYPGERYNDLVSHMKIFHLQDIFRKNIEVLVSGSAPIDYARIQDAFDKVINSMPELASQRDCSFIAAHVHEEVPSDEKKTRSFVSRMP